MIIEDLTPKMNISLRLTPFLHLDGQDYQGESSDTKIITVCEPNAFIESCLSPIAILKGSNGDLLDIQFKKTGYIVSRSPFNYG